MVALESWRPADAGAANDVDDEHEPDAVAQFREALAHLGPLGTGWARPAVHIGYTVQLDAELERWLIGQGRLVGRSNDGPPAVIYYAATINGVEVSLHRRTSEVES